MPPARPQEASDTAPNSGWFPTSCRTQTVGSAMGSGDRIRGAFPLAATARPRRIGCEPRGLTVRAFPASRSHRVWQPPVYTEGIEWRHQNPGTETHRRHTRDISEPSLRRVTLRTTRAGQNPAWWERL